MKSHNISLKLDFKIVYGVLNYTYSYYNAYCDCFNDISLS